jgi:hypothetical protein
LVDNCTFNECVDGISSEYSIFTFGLQSGVHNSIFSSCNNGIVSRNSNHSIKANYFNHNQTGILSHAGSNLNLSVEAFNVLNNDINNLAFMDSEPYISAIQLVKGHNDFYHQNRENPVNDFSFDTFYYDFPLHGDPTIDANANWFEDERVVFNSPSYAEFVKIDCYDPDPNSTSYSGSNRLITALDFEKQSMYDQAISAFKTIIDDPLESEKIICASAIDGVYRLSQAITDSTWVLLDYLDAKVIQYSIDNPHLSSLLKDYYAKTLIINKDFQNAIDLIQMRIDNPVSEIDSLRAVLDLEIVLQLAAMEELKKPITTKYTQYKYPTIQVFNSKHKENWAKLYTLMAQGGNDVLIPIPSVPVVSSNYPNPFNPSTTIEFSVPVKANTRLAIYNLKGQKVKDILNTELECGQHKAVWDGRDKNGRIVSSGIYFIKLVSGGKSSIRKAMLMK